MRAQEFVNEDGFTPAQQAAQRAGMGTKAWAMAEPATKGMFSTMGKVAGKALPLVGTAMSVDDAIERWQAGDRDGAVISALSAAGYLVPGPTGYVLGGGLEAVNSLRDAGVITAPGTPAARPDPFGAAARQKTAQSMPGAGRTP